MNKSIATGIALGAVATLPMTIVHFLALKVGLFPPTKPIFIVVAIRIFGSGLPDTLLLALGLACHLAYGGFWGGVLLAMTRRVTIWKGIGMGVFLWLIMQIGVLPFLGRGIFGGHVSWRFAPASMLTHVVYGATLGWLGTRLAPAAHPAVLRGGSNV